VIGPVHLAPVALAAFVALSALGALGASACAARPRSETDEVTKAAEQRGRADAERYGCDACHAIGGSHDNRFAAAAPLDAAANSSLIAGTVPNTLENMTEWIQNPPRLKPGTAMPALALSADDARDIALYLYSLR
jgi:cytochrome c2